MLDLPHICYDRWYQKQLTGQLKQVQSLFRCPYLQLRHHEPLLRFTPTVVLWQCYDTVQELRYSLVVLLPSLSYTAREL